MECKIKLDFGSIRDFLHTIIRFHYNVNELVYADNF